MELKGNSKSRYKAYSAEFKIAKIEGVHQRFPYDN